MTQLTMPIIRRHTSSNSNKQRIMSKIVDSLLKKIGSAEIISKILGDLFFCNLLDSCILLGC